MANEYLVQRTANARFTIPNASATSNITSDVIIPAGAIITGMRVVAHDAVTLTGASATVVPRVGTVPIAATQVVSALPAVSTPAISAIATTAGIYSGGGVLNLQCQASSNSAATAVYDYYVDYLYVNPS